MGVWEEKEHMGCSVCKRSMHNNLPCKFNISAINLFAKNTKILPSPGFKG